MPSGSHQMWCSSWFFPSGAGGVTPRFDQSFDDLRMAQRSQTPFTNSLQALTISRWGCITQVALHANLSNLCSSDKCDRCFIPAIRSIAFNVFSLLVPGCNQENQVMRHVNQSASISRTKHMTSSTREAWFLNKPFLASESVRRRSFQKLRPGIHDINGNKMYPLVN